MRRPTHPLPLPRLVWTCLALALPLLPGCFSSGPSVSRTYYSLRYALETSGGTRYASPRFPFVLRVDRFDSALAYDKQELVYRSNPYEYQYYPYRLWSAKPRKMLSEMVAAHLRRTNIVANVVDQIEDKLPEYTLQGEVVAIEELDSTAESWYAHLAMRLSLVRFSDNKQVFSFSFDVKRPVHERQPVFVVRELSTILEEQLQVLSERLDAFLARTHPSYPAPTPAPVAEPGSQPVAPGGADDPAGSDGEPKARLIR